MKIQHNNVILQNLKSPEAGDLDFLQKEIGVSSSVLNDLFGTNKRPKIEEYDNFFFLVIHFPVFNEETRQTTPTELDFIVSKDAVFMVYQNSNPTIEILLEDLKDNAGRRNEYFKNAGWLLFCILDALIDSCLPMLDHIHEKIEDIEQQMFQNKEKEMLREIAILKRDIIDFRRTIKPQRTVLELLSKKASRLFDANLDVISQEVIGSETRVWNTLENHKEMIEAIETTNSGLLSFQINQVMRTLTFFSIVLFSLTFIASFFSMKVLESNSGANLRLIIGLMLAAILLIVIVFKKKRWI